MSLNSLRAVAVFFLLVGIGFAGRFLSDTPNFTPTVAVALFAGFYFKRAMVAAAVPVFAVALSNIWLPHHSNLAVMITVYFALSMPVLLGGLLRRSGKTRLGTAARIATAALVPSFAFYVSTNLAVWWFDTIYAHTTAGLVSCYVHALPFYRAMLQGDLLFIPMIFGAYAAARVVAMQRKDATAATLAA